MVAIYGGASMGQQVDALEDGAEIIVGTPGRVYDHIRRGNAEARNDAHRGARRGGRDALAGLLRGGHAHPRLPAADRQTLLFSATVPPDIEQLIAEVPSRPAKRSCCRGDVFTVEGIHNVLYYTVDRIPSRATCST